MQSSRDDGKFNDYVCPQRDTLINVNSFISLGQKVYTPEELALVDEVNARCGW